MDKNRVKDILSDIGIDYKEHPCGFQFRCPLCGDSKKSLKKRRGWILIKNDRINYFCHNCSSSMSLKTFLRENYSDTYKKYFNIFVSYKRTIRLESNQTDIKEEVKDIVQNLKNIIDRVAFHIYDRTIKSLVLKNLQLTILKYLVQRKIPQEKIKDIYIGIDNLEENGHKFFVKNRIIIPYFKDDIIYAFQARSLIENDDYKYLTFIGDNKIKIYNYYNIDKKLPVYIFEGPIDSFFVDNSIATSGSITVNSETYKRHIESKINPIWVFDNDSTGLKRTSEFLKNNQACFIWPEKYRNIKDINDLVTKMNFSKEKIKGLIDENIYNGYQGIIKLKLQKGENNAKF